MYIHISKCEPFQKWIKLIECIIRTTSICTSHLMWPKSDFCLFFVPCWVREFFSYHLYIWFRFNLQLCDCCQNGQTGIHLFFFKSFSFVHMTTKQQRVCGEMRKLKISWTAQKKIGGKKSKLASDNRTFVVNDCLKKQQVYKDVNCRNILIL